ncbi:MAG: hypothetical protein JXA13_07445 [Anaerolineales bacterium]|nr:hypothetical protein [Anaerolineales bacterium]
MHDVKSLLKATGSSQLGKTVYDTAWVARLNSIDPQMANTALDWVCEHQLADGSWGAAKPLYYHDRVVCTLGAMIALYYRGRRSFDRLQIDKGLHALDQITSGATQGLRADPNGATVGFEMIVPTLVAEAEKFGIIQQQADRILGRLKMERKAKLEKLNGLKISRLITVAHSAEMVGNDRLDMLDVENLQEFNGSVGNSPAATSHFLLNVRQQDEKALSYIQGVTNSTGGAPTITPIEIFERIWVLWNLTLADLHKKADIYKLCLPHVDYIEKNLNPGKGLGFSSQYSLPDGDDTSVGFEILHTFDRETDIESVLSFEEENWFRCFQLEISPSIDVNVHVLGALHKAGYSADHPTIKKILDFLLRKRQLSKYWFDKWHVSAYYTTTHAIINCELFNKEMCKPSIHWILDTQRSNGSWGFGDFPTAEETAYSLQALSTWKRRGGKIPQGRIEHGRNWLLQNCEPPYPPLWIDKSLYCPELMVQAAILSALALSEE